MIDAERLRELGEDLTRIAGELANVRGYRAPVDQTNLPASTIRDEIRLRRLRDEVFGNGLFSDPAWDMLLELAARQAEGSEAPITHLCDASAVAQTTGLRWISTLESLGLIERESDPDDRRKVHLRLTSRGWQGMSGYFAATRRKRVSVA